MTEEKNMKGLSLMIVMFLMVTSAIFQGCCEGSNKTMGAAANNNVFGSSVVFPITGNIYPLGYYSVNIEIGSPPKSFNFDIDTGSLLTWVQCDAPCLHCTVPVDKQYKPKDNFVHPPDPLCQSIESMKNYPRGTQDPRPKCDYKIVYADGSSSRGVLVKDEFPLQLTNGSHLRPVLAFGCGYDQEFPGSYSTPTTAGVLALGRGKVSIVSQLGSAGVTQNVMGHCLSRGGGGYLFFGNGIAPSSGVTWTPIVIPPGSSDMYYRSGPAELLFDGKPSGIKGLELVFDSGTTYTYFNAQAYQNTVNLIRRNLGGKPLKDAPEDKSLPICWKDSRGRPINSTNDVKAYFNTLALSFANARDAQLQLAPQDYLIVSELKNVCLGILDGSQAGLGNVNVIGDIFLQDKMVIYDDDKQQIGWITANCNRRLPN